MADKPGGGPPADAVNDRLLELLEQVVANQAVQAAANLHGEVAERLVAQQRRNHGGPPALGVGAQQVALRFGALRNALGDFGRHGERMTALILPAPQLRADGALEFGAPLPHTASTVTLFRADGSVLGSVDGVGGATPVIEDAGDVAWLQVDDADDNPLLLGFPLRAPGNVIH